MNLEIKINPKFPGPTLLELQPVLNEITGVVEVFWTNSKAEIALLRANKDRTYILNVKDIWTQERTSSALGIPFEIDPILLDSARLALKNRRSFQNWENINNNYGGNIGRMILTRLLADSIRKGGDPRVVAPVALECLLEGVQAIDAVVLLRIRILRGH